MEQVLCPFTWSAVVATTLVCVPLVRNEDVSQHLPDTGASKSIIEGDIKIKNGSAIESFTENGLRFTDGTELQADIIVFATGYGNISFCRAGLIPAYSYGDPRDFMREVCGDEVASKITRVWGLDEEGQSAGVWRYCGHDGLWFANGMRIVLYMSASVLFSS
jgi:hypothetical protein